MKKICVLVLVAMVSVSAGVLDSSKVVLPHAGSQALEFGYSGVFSLGSYLGSTIALKKFSSPLKAKRYLVSISSDGYDHSGLRHEFEYDPHPADSTIDSTTFDYTSSSSRHNVSITMQWIKYLEPYEHLSLLYGVGPEIGFSRSTRDNALDPRRQVPYSDWQQNKDATTAIYLGLTPVVGIEWFAHKNLSFHAEYYSLINVGYRDVIDRYEREYSSGDWYQSDSDYSGVYYSVRGYARGGVSFYFK